MHLKMSDLHHILDTAVGKTISWLSAFLGIGTFAGVVSTTVGVLSGIWLLVTLWNYFKYTLPANKRMVAQWKDEAKERESE